MAMNDEELERVVSELQPVVGSSFQNLWQPARDRVVLGFSDGTLLLMVPRGPLARLHTVSCRPKNPQKPFSFQGAGRSRLHGPLTALRKDPGDRVVRLEFGRSRLELRLTGRSGGLWLLEGDEVVAAYDGPAPAELPPLPEREPRADAARFAPGPDGSWDLAARRWFTDLERARDRAERRARVEQSLRRALQRNDRLLTNLEDDLRKADRAPVLRHQADLLTANLYRVPRGASAIDVEDWDTGQSVSLTLDPSRSATFTLDRLYHQVKRLERVADRVLARMDIVAAEQRTWSAALQQLDSLDLEALVALEAKLPKTVGRVRPSADQKQLPYIEWTGPAGERVLVGRNEKGNRKLTFQIARGHDWWMHVRGRPAAHVVIPVAKDQTPPLELLLAAAQIALIQAMVVTSESAEVQYTRIRDVRSIPGEIGRVTIQSEKVLRVTRDPAALVGWTTDLTTAPG